MSSNKKYVVRLTDEERNGLEAMVKKGRAAAYKIRHANILLKADAEVLELALVTVKGEPLLCGMELVDGMKGSRADEQREAQ